MEGSDAAAAPQPLRMDIRPAGVKGMGAFAAEPATTGAWVCTYEGELLTLDQVLARYDDEDPAYLFSLGDGASLYLDGARGSHPSRYINHHQNGSLVPRVSLQDQRVDFFAARDLAPGDELTFDYGEAYWLGLPGAPSADTDARAFQLGKASDWRGGGGGTAPSGPPPLLARSLCELTSLDALDDAAETRRALLRTLEFLGVQRGATGELEVPTTLRDLTAPRRRVWPDEAPVAALREACEGLLRQMDG